MEMTLQMMDVVNASCVAVRAEVPGARQLSDLALTAIVVGALREAGFERERWQAGAVALDVRGDVQHSTVRLALIKDAVNRAVARFEAGGVVDATPIVHHALWRFMSLSYAAGRTQHDSFHAFLDRYLPMLGDMGAVQCKTIAGVRCWLFTNRQFAHLCPIEMMP